MGAIALRDLATRKLRAGLTAFAIVLGVMMIAGTYILTDTIDSSFDKIFTESSKGTNAVVAPKETIEIDDNSTPSFRASELRTVERVDGVAAAAGGVFDGTAAIFDKDGDRLGGGGAPTFASSVLPERFDPFTYVEGRKPQGANEVVLDKQTAENGHFKLGDRVEVAGKAPAKRYVLVGIAKLGDVSSFGGAGVAMMTLPEVQRLMGKQDRFDSISVAADPGLSDEQLKQRLQAALPNSLQVETNEENIQSQRDDISEFTGFFRTILLVFSGVALLVGAFLIFNTFSITIAQRTREFAMLRTVGASRRQIMTSVILESLVIGLIGSGLGLLAGIGFAPAVNALFESVGIDLPNSGTIIATRTVVVSLLVGTSITVVAALVPALRATRVDPVQGLREGASLETPRSHRVRTAIAAGLTALGALSMLLGVFGALDPGELWVGVGAFAVFIGVALLSPRLVKPLAAVFGRPIERLAGISGKLARENSMRNPGRTASTAAALMIGLALVSFVAIFAAGLKGSINDAFDKTIVADLVVGDTEGFQSMPVGAQKPLSEIKGVEVASPTRYAQDRVKGDDGYATLVDTKTIDKVMTLDWKDGDVRQLSELGPRDAVVDEKWARGKDIDIGETFSALTPSGKRLNFTVRGDFVDNADFNGDYVASDVNAPAFNQADVAQNILLELAPGATEAQVRPAVEKLVETQYPAAQVKNQDEFKGFIADQLDQILAVVYALLFLSVIVSLFGIVNTLALSIHERTRELGLLRAVGMSRRQVRRVVRWESVITALIGATLGAILGVIFALVISRPLADEGFTLSIPVGTLIALMVLAAVAGVIAAIGPARRASRLDVLKALAYE
jgi:putative ABC transport system permease protein